jgi:hypothetical protein
VQRKGAKNAVRGQCWVGVILLYGPAVGGSVLLKAWFTVCVVVVIAVVVTEEEGVSIYCKPNSISSQLFYLNAMPPTNFALPGVT